MNGNKTPLQMITDVLGVKLCMKSLVGSLSFVSAKTHQPENLVLFDKTAFSFRPEASITQVRATTCIAAAYGVCDVGGDNSLGFFLVSTEEGDITALSFFPHTSDIGQEYSRLFASFSEFTLGRLYFPLVGANATTYVLQGGATKWAKSHKDAITAYTDLLEEPNMTQNSGSLFIDCFA